MNDVFQWAVDSLLALYGCDAKIKYDTETEGRVKASPLFSSRLQGDKSAAQILASTSNVMVVPENPDLKIVPGKSRYLQNGTEFGIVAVANINAAGKIIAYELELRN